MSTGYQDATTAPTSCSWSCHRNRTPPSSEPGTDEACSYGTPVLAAEAGRVSTVERGNSGPDGRRVTIDLDDGRRVSYLHLSETLVDVGDRVTRAQVVGKSGGSGYDSDWYYGPHVHVSLWDSSDYAWTNTIDFKQHVGDPEEDDVKVNHFGKVFTLADGGHQTIAAGHREFLNVTHDSSTGTRIVTGPNLDVEAVITIAFAELPLPTVVDGVVTVPESVQVEPFVTTRDGSEVTNTSLSRIDVPASAGQTRIKVPVSAQLDDNQFLRVAVSAPAGQGSVRVLGANVRGVELT